MSLKSVHICFILLSIGFCWGFGFWAVRNYSSTGNGIHLLLGIASLLGGAALVYYLIRFVQKMKKIAPLSLLLAIIPAAFFPRPVLACSVCFGDPHSKLTQGVIPAVLFLTGVVGLVLLAIASTGFIWAQRARKLARSPH